MSGCRQYRLEGVVHTTGLAGGFDLSQQKNEAALPYHGLRGPGVGFSLCLDEACVYLIDASTDFALQI